MPLLGLSRKDLTGLVVVTTALAMILVAGLSTLRQPQQTVSLLQSKPMSDQAWKKHLLHVRERQLEFEKDDAALMKSLHSRDHSVQAMLGQDDFNPAVLRQSQPSRSTAPRSVAKTKRRHATLTPEKKAMLELAKIQKRRQDLLKVAVSQLSEDKEKVVADVVSGRSAQLKQERRRVIGDERLVALLEASVLAAGGSDGETEEEETKPAPKIVQGHRHVADVLQDNDAALLKAGVKTNKDFTPWLMGMHEAMSKKPLVFRAHKNTDGSEKLLKAGVAVDRLPGFGEDYRKAIPLPAYHDDLGWANVFKSLSSGHRPLSTGYQKMHQAGVNVNAANALVYGTKQHGTPEADRTTTPFHYADGLEDEVTDATAARKHAPISFVLHDIKRGSKPLEHAGLNVWGSDVFKGLVPSEVESWDNQVPAEQVHHPAEGEDADAPAEEEEEEEAAGEEGGEAAGEGDAGADAAGEGEEAGDAEGDVQEDAEGDVSGDAEEDAGGDEAAASKDESEEPSR